VARLSSKWIRVPIRSRFTFQRHRQKSSTGPSMMRRSRKVWLLSGRQSLRRADSGWRLDTIRKAENASGNYLGASYSAREPPTAWQSGTTSALAIATALSQAVGSTLPWKTVRDSSLAPCRHGSSLFRRFGHMAVHFSGAQAAKIKIPTAGKNRRRPSSSCAAQRPRRQRDFEPAQIQDWAISFRNC